MQWGEREPSALAYGKHEQCIHYFMHRCADGQRDAQARARAPVYPLCARPSTTFRKAADLSSKCRTTRSIPHPPARFSLVHQCVTSKAQFNIMAIMRIVQCSKLYRGRRQRRGWGVGEKKMQVLSTLKG